MLRRIRTLLLIVAVIFQLLFAAACVNYKNVKIPTIENISDFRAGKMENGLMGISFKTQLDNPDLLKFRIKKTRLDVFVKGIKVGEINSKRTIRIKRLLKPEVNWELTADLKPIMQNPGALLGAIATGKTELELKGDITIAKWFYKKTIPVNLKKPVQLPSFF